MPHRVRDVLLVSSLYDAFILQEDAHLSEQIFLEYKSLSLSSAPMFTHVTGGEAAIEAMKKRRSTWCCHAAHRRHETVGPGP
jgi:hypothetical protein